MGLFDPVWKTGKTEKLQEALAAVREVSDPKKLREIALTAYLPEVRFAALEKISDPRVLQEVILENSTPYEIRREAVERITDPEVLTEIAMQRQAYPADGDAIAKLTDQALLKRIALCEQGGEQDKAVYKITGQRDLAEIAVDAKKGSARKTAIRNITDAGILLDILSEAEEVYTRSEAFDRLLQLRDTPGRAEMTEAQHRQLIDVIIHESDRNVRISLRDFTRAEDLERIYREAARYDLRARALGKLVADPSYPNSLLQEAWKTADAGRETVHNTYSNPWQDAQDRVEARLESAESEEPSLLLDFISDPEVGSRYAAVCLKKLFSAELQDRQGIGDLRDEAFAAYLRNIPHYAKEDGTDDLSSYLIGLLRIIPDELQEYYGLSVFRDEYEPSENKD